MQITVQTPSRLHFGLIDLNGELGRINGSFGVALEEPSWLIKYYSDAQKIDPIILEKNTLEVISKFDDYFGVASSDLKLAIIDSIPRHIGLGSNTQFLLALGSILSRIHKLDVSVTEIAKAVQRGGTSGIGVASFDKGGFILDGGHTFGPGKQTETFQPSSISKAPPPPVIFRHYPPENWHFVLISPTAKEGASGKKEVSLFRDNCPIPAEGVEKLSRLLLMKILPSIIEKDIKAFGEGLTSMQHILPKFGMDYYSSDFSQEIFTHLQKNEKSFGHVISSFGPTVFALTDSETSAKSIINSITENYSKQKFNILTKSKINTTGASIVVDSSTK
ncbi:MAG: beta-ribofuranosylaminobenzene 5'-phosphate synthase family protein [Candidatus Heimdallarchaeota archaeon]